MRINKSGATVSKIVDSGKRIQKLQTDSRNEYLFLNRGINAVCSINLDSVIEQIDFNSADIQVYPAFNGKKALREAINSKYFLSKSDANNILISTGAVAALDLTFQVIDVEKVFIPEYFWGTYQQILTIRKHNIQSYSSLNQILENPREIKNSAIVICDPNNPLGNKLDDAFVLEATKRLNELSVIVIFDSPYRRVFYDDNDDFYAKLSEQENTIILESFSKSIGLSGQRLGFIHSTNQEFLNETGLRLLYSTNGINAFSQVLVEKLLTTDEGQKAIQNFKQKTTNDIKLNINYLIKKNLLAEEYYLNSIPVGIFVACNRSEKELLTYRIGSVDLSYFTINQKNKAQNYSRICVSVPNEKFVSFFQLFE